MDQEWYSITLFFFCKHILWTKWSLGYIPSHIIPHMYKYMCSSYKTHTCPWTRTWMYVQRYAKTSPCIEGIHGCMHAYMYDECIRVHNPPKYHLRPKSLAWHIRNYKHSTHKMIIKHNIHRISTHTHIYRNIRARAQDTTKDEEE